MRNNWINLLFRSPRDKTLLVRPVEATIDELIEQVATLQGYLPNTKFTVVLERTAEQLDPAKFLRDYELQEGDEIIMSPVLEQ